MDAFKMAGALVVGNTAWGIIMARPSPIMDTHGKNPAVIPLAIPKTAGPGTIATVITLGESGVSIVSRIFGLLLLSIVITSIMESLLQYFPGWAGR